MTTVRKKQSVSRRGGSEAKANGKGAKNGVRPTAAQRKYLVRGLKQAGGKLPIFDDFGQEVDARTVRACINAGWAEPWFANPIKPDWLVCKLSALGRVAVNKEN